jgi:2-oxoisovalerate dehydrogenase E1 component beta subunit
MATDPSGTTMAGALNAALRDAMTADGRVLVFGEDVGRLGGVFRVTDGLLASFGEQRCFDTPLAEAGIVGFAVGMAMYGFRPVVELQFDAFAYPALEQIFSHVAKMGSRTAGRVRLPLVIRIPFGGGIGAVEHHSDCGEAYYAHTAGLKVVCPATVADAYSLLREAIDDPDPVIFFEPKKMYWLREPVELPARTEPFGRAVVRRPGRDVTVVAYGPALPAALEAAEVAGQYGWDVEVVDVRTIVPFDDATVCASVRRTGRCVVVHEAAGFAGVGAEIAARVQERCFHSLAAPVLRATGFDVPYPPPRLEGHHLPGTVRILDAIDRLQWDDVPDPRWLTPPVPAGPVPAGPVSAAPVPAGPAAGGPSAAGLAVAAGAEPSL